MPTNDTPAPREPRCFPTEKDFAALDATEARQTARVAKSDAAWEAVAGLVEGPSGEPLPGSRAVTNEELILSEEIYAAGGDAEARLAERCNAERKSRISIIREYGDPRTWTLPTPAAPAPRVVGGEPPSVNYGLTREDVAAILSRCGKPEEISGPLREARIRELVRWFARYTRGAANPKWFGEHAYELVYALATAPSPLAAGGAEPDEVSREVYAAWGTSTREQLLGAIIMQRRELDALTRSPRPDRKDANA